MRIILFWEFCQTFLQTTKFICCARSLKRMKSLNWLMYIYGWICFYRLLALSIVFGAHNDDLSTCTNGHLLKIYYVGMLVILPLEILFSITIMHFSMKGTITNDQPRRHIPNLIICKLFLFFIEIVWTIMGTNWAFSIHVQHCSYIVVNVVKGATIVGWILLLFLVVGITIVFDSLGSPLTETPSQLQRLWKMR